MLYNFCYITYLWNGSKYEVTLRFRGTENVDAMFKVMHPDAVIISKDYEM